MNPNQNKCTLDQLLEHAESQSLEDRQTRFRTERLEEFKGSEIYLDNASFLILRIPSSVLSLFCGKGFPYAYE